MSTAPWATPTATGPVTATLVVPGSKSATARALVLAALATGTGEIVGGLEARDTRLMRDALRTLGVSIDDSDLQRWVVTPPASFVGGGEIDCGLAGTVARFVPPLAALAGATTRFRGDEQASARPVQPLLDGLRQCGASVVGDRLPFEVTGPVTSGTVSIDASGSSQFVSGLLLSGCRFPGGLRLRHVGRDPVPSLPHVEMTVEWLRARGVRVATPDTTTWEVAPGVVAPVVEHVEPDLTTAAVFLASALVVGGRVTVRGWPTVSTQPGIAVPDVLGRFGGHWTTTPDGLTVEGDGSLAGGDFDLSATSELLPLVGALAALAKGPTTIRGVAHVRGHETDRLAALRTELNALGGDVTETADGLIVRPVALHGGLFRSYADHRMAHAAAVLGLAVPGISVDDVACTSKTMPGFERVWQAVVA